MRTKKRKQTSFGLLILSLCIIWFVSLFNGTGLGENYQTNKYARILVVIIFFAILLNKYRMCKTLSADYSWLFCFGSMFLVFLVSSYVKGYGGVALEYLWCLLLVYVVSRIKVSDRALRIIGIVFLILGAAILYIFSYRSELRGWNGNSIAMVSFLSYIVFYISIFKARKLMTRVFASLLTVAYVLMLEYTNSRSCIFSMIIILLLLLFSNEVSRILKYRQIYLIMLLVPLIIAVIVLTLSKTGYIAVFDNWSYSVFSKPFTNGRNILWSRAYDTFFVSPFFGTGQLTYTQWHNSAISCLVTYGVFGYVLWIACQYLILTIGIPYIEDSIVSGCIISYFVISVQQATELGIISTNPNPLFYLPLSLMIGRIRFIKSNLTQKE